MHKNLVLPGFVALIKFFHAKKNVEIRQFIKKKKRYHLFTM